MFGREPSFKPAMITPPLGRQRLRWMLLGVALALLFVGAVGAVVADQLVGPAHTARERGWALLRQQNALFPPYPGSEAEQTLGAEETWRDPGFVTSYAYASQCTDLQAYYATQAAQQGWRMPDPMLVIYDPADPHNAGHDQLASVYDKVVGNYSLQMEVDCFRDQSYSPGYTFGMTAHYNLLA